MRFWRPAQAFDAIVHPLVPILRRAGHEVTQWLSQAPGPVPGDVPQPAEQKDVSRLVGRFSLDFAAVREDFAAVREDSAAVREEALGRADPSAVARASVGESSARPNPAILRLEALASRDAGPEAAGMPVAPALANWTPLGPLAVPEGQTYGGARVLISGRVTAIAPHPTNGDRIYIGTSRGGVWRTDDAGRTWSQLGDDQPSLAIGALAVGVDDPQVLYAGTGEGNVQRYSTANPLGSAPGVYLGVGVLRTTDGGASWSNDGTDLLADHSFYRIAVRPADARLAFAATSRGLCRTTDGVTWTALSGGLPAIDDPVIACTDVLVDASDVTGNTVYAAFWGSGVYRSTNALAPDPSFALVSSGLPPGASTSRISLAQSASNPAFRYALVAGVDDSFLGLYRTASAAGTSWQLCTSDRTVRVFGAFTSDVNVDPTTPDLVYISGVELYACRRNVATDSWSVSNIGRAIHPDSHAFGFHPSLNRTIYSGNDGGFYVSRDAGASWDDTPNEGLCLMQYEAIDSHPTSDAVVQCGTQDNGTQQYRNSPVHYHSADGDGGYCTISKVDPNNVTHAYFGNKVERSTVAGEFGSYGSIADGLDGRGLFYPPSAISPTSERLAWATDLLNIDDAMGTGGWPGTGVPLPGITGRVSAVSFSNDALLYCATTSGQVYRVALSGGTWRATAIHAAPLPTRQWIWDVHSLPGDDDTIVVAFSGFGLASHVWQGTVPAAGAATWADVSAGLPDVPMYALCLTTPRTWYVGTDIGVFRTTDGGASWSNFSQGLPNTAVYDLRIRTGGVLMRAATHGRGLWEIRTDLAEQHTVDLFVRDHLMDTGRPPNGAAAVKAAWRDPTRHVTLNSPCHWWECADIKTDAPPTWQLLPDEVDYLRFETKLVHESPAVGDLNRVYVQVHNRGPLPASDVVVAVMTTDASAGLPDLPADFWTTWPHSEGDAHWTPAGAPQTIANLEPLRPTVLEWTWTPPPGADAHRCIMVVVDSASDPVPDDAKVLDVASLVTREKRVGLSSLHLVDVPPEAFALLPLHLHAPNRTGTQYVVRLPALDDPRLDVGVVLTQESSSRARSGAGPGGLVAAELSADDLGRLRHRWISEEMRPVDSWDRLRGTFDVNRVYRLDAGLAEVDVPLQVGAGGHEPMLLMVRTLGAGRPSDPPARLTVQQLTTTGEVVGGSTFLLRPVAT